MLTAGYGTEIPISKPLHTIGVGQAAASFRDAARSWVTLYSRKRLFWSMGRKAPAMTERSFTFARTRSFPLRGEYLSSGVSSTAARLEKYPTCTKVTDWSGCALKILRSKSVAAGASELRLR